MAYLVVAYVVMAYIVMARRIRSSEAGSACTVAAGIAVRPVVPAAGHSDDGLRIALTKVRWRALAVGRADGL